MSMHRVVARMFAELMLNPAFTLVSSGLYFNEFFRAGQRLVGMFEGVQVFVSESDSSVPGAPGSGFFYPDDTDRVPRSLGLNLARFLCDDSFRPKGWDSKLYPSRS